MCAGTREDGTIIEANDPYWDDLAAAAQRARARPLAWLEQRNIYGDLATNARFAEAFARWLGLIWSEGSAAALRLYTEGANP
jgi:mannitol 2-dehydrogenase